MMGYYFFYACPVMAFFLGFTLIVIFYVTGELLVWGFSVPLPGSLIGLLLLLAFQFAFKRRHQYLFCAATPLLRHMSLLFVPAVLGGGLYWQEIANDIWAIGFAIVVTTSVSLAATAYLAQRFMERIVVKGRK